MKSQRGFSMTEWLTLLVLALAGIAIIIPVYLSHAEKVKRQGSHNNLLQWGIALNLYLIENQNKLPHPGSDTPSSDDDSAWYNTLPLYLSQPALTDAGAASLMVQSLWINPAAPKRPLIQGNEYFFYYAMNQWLKADINGTPEPLRIYDIEDPTATVFMTENFGAKPYVTHDSVDYRFGKKPPSPEAKAHVLFSDGHVEIIEKKQLSDDPAAFDPQGGITQPTWVPYYNAPSP